MRYLQGFIAVVVVLLTFGVIQNTMSEKSRRQDTPQTVLSQTLSDQTPAQTTTRDGATLRRIEERERLRQAAADANEEDFG